MMSEEKKIFSPKLSQRPVTYYQSGKITMAANITIIK